MNAQLLNLNPLSSALHDRVSANPSRRHFVGNVSLRNKRLDAFNRWMRKLHHAPLDCDQIATVSRELPLPSSPAGYSASIEQRIQLAYAIRHMLTDPDWRVAAEASAPAHLVLDYMHTTKHLVPSNMPVFGRLDDAIVIDVAWPQLSDEVENYADFCRIREIEAAMRECGIGDFAFTRDDWLEAREAEARLIRDHDRSSASSYLPQTSGGLFRIH